MLDCCLKRKKKQFLYHFIYFYITLYDFINCSAFVDIKKLSIKEWQCSKYKQREMFILYALFLVCFPFLCWLVVVSHLGDKKKWSLQGELLGCFLHCTLECHRPYVPTTSFRLWNKVECQYYNDTNISPC